MNQTSHTRANAGSMNKPANLIDTTNVRASNRFAKKSITRWLVPGLYILFLMLPIYWLINMSFKTNQEILSSFTLFPPSRPCTITP
jgi:glycerol transport system permease protein